jgi:DNA-binding GntR family transcriptional regulator
MSEHRKVLESIAAPDPDAARAARPRHLDPAYKRVSKGWNARTSPDAADVRQRGASGRAAG